jgi:hypothetical protein
VNWVFISAPSPALISGLRRKTMKALIASIAALGLVASPVVAAAKSTPKPAASSTAKEAKAEGESVKTEAKEKKAAARHHAARCGCPSKYAKSHKTAKKSMAKKTTAKSTKTKS